MIRIFTLKKMIKDFKCQTSSDETEDVAAAAAATAGDGDIMFQLNDERKRKVFQSLYLFT